jgi:type I restriction enzyme S subunit
MSDMQLSYKRTDVGVIPDEWESTLLGKVVSLRRGHDLTERQRRQGPVPVTGSAGQNGYHDTAIAKGPGVVIGRSGSSYGQAHFCRDDYWPHNTALYVTDFQGNDPKYVFYFLKGFDFRSHNSGGAQQSLNRNFIAPLAVTLPPLPEQLAIAKVLGDADRLIVALEALIAKKRDIKQGAMQELLIGRRRLPGFQGKWLERPLLECVSIRIGQVDPKQEPYKSMLLVGPEHIEEATGRMFAPQTAAEQRAISGKYQFARGDIIYGKINPHLRKAALASFDGICSADLYPLRPAQGFSGRFLLGIILGEDFSQYAISLSARSGIPKINRTELSGFSFSLPPTLDEQRAIAGVLSDMDAEIAAVEGKLAKARAVKQGMMQVLLTGEVRLV